MSRITAAGRGGILLAYIEALGIHKRFGGVVALNGANFACAPGEVHALLGANGSGKSTLAKIITGVVAPDAGEIRVDGQTVTVSGPADMYRLGIASVYQELSLIPQLSVAENILLGHEATRACLIDNRAIWAQAARLLEHFSRSLGRSLPIHAVVEELSPAEQQLVEIAKALSRSPRLLILDEATASLHSREVEALFELVRGLKDKGCTVIFISHRMEEVFRLCDRATVLRNGQTVATVDLKTTSPDELLQLMVGETERPERVHKEVSPGRVVLKVEKLRAGRVLREVSFTVRAGEVVGLGGLQGQGQSELLKAVFGAYPLESGLIEIEGRRARIRRPADAIRAGVVLVPGNRAHEGLCLPRSTFENTTLPSLEHRSRCGLLSASRERRAANEVIQRLEVKVADIYQPVSTLSGGNQQKVVIGKWLLNNPKVLLMDDPTKGVDVRTRLELYRVIKELCSRDVGVLINSTDNAELLAVCDRVLVLYEGQIVDELTGDDLNEANLVAAGLRMTASAHNSTRGETTWGE
ncbi:MAG TPA: sugar ABC transporter ATP-binding protein [Firmicutes bacterium]|nr:sugar ABC transporter ATP-binding protein [Bacillota bacterium]